VVTKLDAIRRFLTSAHVLHMEAEIAQLRGQLAMLHLQLIEALKPAAPAPAVKREFPKFQPQQTSWEAYLAEQIRLQEEEEVTDGPHSGGRK
jgi:hypothetical protein